MTLFFSSDHHLNHSRILTFISEDTGLPFRGQFSNVEEMNEHIIERHNSVVGDNDKVYFLGDVGFNIKNLGHLLYRMKGHKRLILGNHDYTEKKDFELYFQHFEKVMESRRMGPIVLTHRPIYIGAHENRIKANVHGHIHEKNLPDNRYMNISMEQINYTPISLDEIIEHFDKNGIDVSDAS